MGEALRMSNQWQGQKREYIQGNTTTAIVDGPGFLHSVLINVPGGQVSLYDNTAGSGNLIGVFKANLISAQFVVDCAFSVGLTAVTTGTPATTITYSVEA
jgi:hypothetical protein